MRPSLLNREDSEADEPPAIQTSAEAGTNESSTSPKAAPPIAATKEASAFIQTLTIKGATRNGNNSSVTVQYAGKNYVVFVGETVSLPAGGEIVRLKLEKCKRGG